MCASQSTSFSGCISKYRAVSSGITLFMLSMLAVTSSKYPTHTLFFIGYAINHFHAPSLTRPYPATSPFPSRINSSSRHHRLHHIGRVPKHPLPVLQTPILRMTPVRPRRPPRIPLRSRFFTQRLRTPDRRPQIPLLPGYLPQPQIRIPVFAHHMRLHKIHPMRTPPPDSPPPPGPPKDTAPPPTHNPSPGPPIGVSPMRQLIVHRTASSSSTFMPVARYTDKAAPQTPPSSPADTP